MERGIRWLALSAVALGVLAGCASGEQGPQNPREVIELEVAFDQSVVVRSSVLRFVFLGTASRQATVGAVRLSGSLGDGLELDETVFAPVDRVGDKGDLVMEVPVADRLWELVEPAPARTLSGRIDVALEDEIGVFGTGVVDAIVLRFRAEYPPELNPIPSGRDVYPGELIRVAGDGFLRPEEGSTWAVVDRGSVRFPDGASRAVTNARVRVAWDGSRTQALLPVSPAMFGVREGTFEGDLRFENELRTGEVFAGSAQAAFRAVLRPPRVDSISPARGSRGQKITVSGRGFVGAAQDTNSGTYLVLHGRFRPRGGGGDIVLDEDPLILTPHRVVDERTIEQDVSYSVDPVERTLSGLGAIPGDFDGTITPVVYRGAEEQAGAPWTGQFEVLPPQQMVHVKYLPGFSRALAQYGIHVAESAIRERVMEVLTRDYEGTAVTFSEAVPEEFIEYTTVEIGGPDPSGLLNFGYDNSYNDGGKDVGNLYLSDYLGGVNRHSQDAGYLPFGGVFIESFIAFSPRLYPDAFGTSEHFDRVLAPFMPALGGTPLAPDEWPDGSRAELAADAVAMLGNLTGHTASHEVGHSLGLAHFPPTVEDFAERFHNDPPGPNLIMDAGADRPFEERAEINGAGPARFSPENLRYLQQILPPTE